VSTASALAVEEVSKRFGAIQALDCVSLSIMPGEIVALLGRNGAGKTTLMSIIVGLARADTGKVTVLGRDVRTEARQVRGVIGLAPQEIAIYPALSARQNLRFFARINGGKAARSTIDERIERASTALGLGSLLDRTADDLSGGEKRRLNTAIALVNDPRLILLDEPTAGSDVESRTALLSILQDLATRGAAVCYCTHYLSEVEAMDARVVILDKGRKVIDGSVEEIIEKCGRSSVIELAFDTAAPVICDGAVKVDGTRMRIMSTSPAADLAQILKRIEGSLTSLRSVEVLKPNLESAYVELTGRRLDGDLAEEAEGP
jgi:ABC-2 type transport system ATP-binding protein